MYFVYVIKSLKSSKLYTGQTNELERRLYQHNNGETKSNKFDAPYDLVYVQICKSRSEAIVLEKFLKTGVGRNFIDRI